MLSVDMALLVFELAWKALFSYQFWLLALLTYILYRHNMKTRGYKLPPRPQSWPIIGNIYPVLFGDEVIYRWCVRMAKEVGPVMRVSFGLTDVVILNDYESVHEAMVDKGMDFAGRMRGRVFEEFTDGYQDVVMANADQPTFKPRRKLLATALKNFTIGREYENRVEETLKKVFEHFDKLAANKESFDPNDYCKLMSYNITASMCFKLNYEFDDPEFIELRDMFQAANDAFQTGVFISDIIPFSRYLPFYLPDTKYAALVRERLLGVIDREIKKSKKRGEETGSVADLTYYILKTKEEDKKYGLSDVTDLEIRHLIADVFGGGVDTTQMSLRWILLCLALYQDIQEKVYQEICDTVDDDSDMISAIDYKSKMPYSEAFVLEATRFGGVAVLGLPHATLTDTTVGGYDIPEGMSVFINQWAILHDERYFNNPDQFLPERFLDEEGRVGPRPKGYVPFGLGRRSCPGETAARSTLWIIFTSLVKRYKLLPPEGVELRPEFKHSAFEGVPKPYKILLERR